MLYQLIGYFEKQLGKSRNDIIDDISAGGVVLAARLTPPKGAVLIVQSKDDAKVRKFLDVAFDIIERELDRQESKDKIVRSKYQGYDVGKIGKDLSFAIADGAVVVAGKENELKAALDAAAKSKNILTIASFNEARKQAPSKALAWTWLHLEELRKNEDFKNGLNAAGMDPFQMVLFGGIADLLRRAPYLTAAIVREGKDFRVAIHSPRGAEGMAPLKHMILPPEGKGVLPPLVPPRVLSSSSFYLDLDQLWQKRVEILGEINAKGLDEGEKNIKKVLGGITLSKLFKAMGPNLRLVFAQQKESPYKIKPAAPFPAFAVVVDMRDPSFGKDMNGILRSAALLATFAVGLQLREETYKDCEMISYYFSETKKVEGDAVNVRFNFSPTYVTVGDQFVVSATAELARDLIDVLKTEQKGTPIQASMRTQVYASGFVQLVGSNEDATMTQLILSLALPPKAAKEEMRAIVNFVERLGTLRLESNYGANDFRYDILWQSKKKQSR
jgi:hypothetical protein